ncbi:P-loop containing nucleoside triphosphate hydrolase protein [Plectosphaerella plurivora]|uniref:P-loop containing nucleoside triphosphate hydrolase protein n=1 Tax=Plectosphaerella plurivora TaxID=936078 RepID=A0A9P9AEN5_9PEZI|nr:P-loop containing nucleoside triphosphate hydrolase protein [Plectosphaerella plurivora]
MPPIPPALLKKRKRQRSTTAPPPLQTRVRFDSEDSSSIKGPAFQLANEETCSRLNQIDKLRALGVGGCVSLPQLVVCGDQSTGKSSVLERLSCISFPRKDGLCTRFATEIVMQHANTPLEVVVTIRPHASRDAVGRAALEAFKKTFSTLEGMDLPVIIEQAGKLMGLRGYDTGTDEGKAFSLDLLHIKVTGPTGLSLTIVDLPGLIAVHNEEQTQDDVNTVHSLADTYLKSPRTIILAVIQAGNDIANQSVVQKAKTHDPEGIRTVGIITKPDLVNAGTESRIVQLANNNGNVRLNLGYFLLKNQAPSKDNKPTDSDDVNKLEQVFFQQPEWQGLDPDRVGIANMKKFLRNLLHEHIEREIPSIKEELIQKLAHAEKELEALGKPRQTAQDVMSFLIEKNMVLHQFAQNALSGNYVSDSAFYEENTRLRAMIHQENMDFADYMREYGAVRKIRHSRDDQYSRDARDEAHELNSLWGIDLANSADPANADNFADSANFGVAAESGNALVVADSVNDAVATVAADARQYPISLQHREMMVWVKEIYNENRGLELPGGVNATLLAELHRRQSSRWITLAEAHLEKVLAMTQEWLCLAIGLVIHDDDIRPKIVEECLNSYMKMASRSHEELRQIWEDEQRHPLTYNHYYTDNVQKSRMSSLDRALDNAFSRAPGRGRGGPTKSDVMYGFKRHLTVNMDKHACEEAIRAMESYYKTAQKSFIDNICRQVIERHVLTPLPTLFSPAAIAKLSEEELLRLGREPAKKQATRQRLATRADIMRKGLQELENNELAGF